MTEYFETADAAIEQLKREGFVYDDYNMEYPWRARAGLVIARLRYSDCGWFLEYGAGFL